MATGLENLKIYQMAESLELEIFEILKSFPKEEKYLTVDQLKRSSASVSNNIAEGYNRYSYKEKIRSLIIAKGEAEETKMNIIKSAKKNFLSQEEAKQIANRYTELLMAISGYIRYIKTSETEKLSNLSTNKPGN
ncbi:four helix bundle protein [Patescibacteria group bacterium]|nr:four helix bundle protein [Patescibacteria group bacterium]